MSYNIKAGMGVKELDTRAATTKILELLEKENSDIVCFQEFPNQQYHFRRTAPQVWENKLDLKHTYYYDAKHLAIISKFPILKKGQLLFKHHQYLSSSGNSCLWADIQITPNKIIRVYNIHFQSIKISPVINELAEEGKEAASKENLGQVKYILSRIRTADRIRLKQVRQVKTHMKQSPYPILVCGDFNDVPFSYNHRLIAEGLQDSFEEKGMGIGGTYALHIPALRIDYILVDTSFNILNHRTIKEAYSDHYPIVSDLEF